LASNEKRRFDLKKNMTRSAKREQYHRSLVLSRDGKLKKFGLLSRAPREASRGCGSWETVGNKGESQEIDTMQQSP